MAYKIESVFPDSIDDLPFISDVDIPNKDIMINMNKILKRNTTDEDNPRYNVGGFKIVPNKIGLINVIDTFKPEDK